MISNIPSTGSIKFQWALLSKLLHKWRAVSFDPGPCDSRALSLENYSKESECRKEERHPGLSSLSISGIVPNECAPESSATINGKSESLTKKIQELHYNYIPQFRNVQHHCEKEGSRWPGLEWSSAGTSFRYNVLDQEQLLLMASLNANENYLQLHVILCHLNYLHFPFFSLFFHPEKQTLENMINSHFADKETDAQGHSV